VRVKSCWRSQGGNERLRFTHTFMISALSDDGVAIPA